MGKWGNRGIDPERKTCFIFSNFKRGACPVFKLRTFLYKKRQDNTKWFQSYAWLHLY